MIFDEATYEQLDRYLRGELQGDTLRAFEDRIAREAALRQEANELRQLLYALNDQGRNALKKQISLIGAAIPAKEFAPYTPSINAPSKAKLNKKLRPKGKGFSRWWFALIPAVLIPVAVLLYLRLHHGPTETGEPLPKTDSAPKDSADRAPHDTLAKPTSVAIQEKIEAAPAGGSINDDSASGKYSWNGSDPRPPVGDKIDVPVHAPSFVSECSDFVDISGFKVQVCQAPTLLQVYYTRISKTISFYTPPTVSMNAGNIHIRQQNGIAYLEDNSKQYLLIADGTKRPLVATDGAPYGSKPGRSDTLRADERCSDFTPVRYSRKSGDSLSTIYVQLCTAPAYRQLYYLINGDHISFMCVKDFSIALMRFARENGAAVVTANSKTYPLKADGVIHPLLATDGTPYEIPAMTGGQ